MPYQMKEIVRCIKILKTITCVFMLFVLIATVRLVNGDSCSGRVEVLYNGSWGTVCDNGWDLTDAAVVCRQVGCGNVIEAMSAASFGQGSGTIWMNDVQCTGNEITLKNCSSNGWGIHNCNHKQDAGVICQRESKIFREFKYSFKEMIFCVDQLSGWWMETTCRGSPWRLTWTNNEQFTLKYNYSLLALMNY